MQSFYELFFFSKVSKVHSLFYDVNVTQCILVCVYLFYVYYEHILSYTLLFYTWIVNLLTQIMLRQIYLHIKVTHWSSVACCVKHFSLNAPLSAGRFCKEVALNRDIKQNL